MTVLETIGIVIAVIVGGAVILAVIGVILAALTDAMSR